VYETEESTNDHYGKIEMLKHVEQRPELPVDTKHTTTTPQQGRIHGKLEQQRPRGLPHQQIPINATVYQYYIQEDRLRLPRKTVKVDLTSSTPPDSLL
jgi:hypothetical protein